MGASASPQRTGQNTCPADNELGACLHQHEGAFPLLRLQVAVGRLCFFLRGFIIHR